MYEYRVEVLRVVDGDTVDVDVDLGFSTWLRDQRIRLAGIGAPESRTKDDMEKLYGQLSKKFLSEMLKNKEITLQSHGKGKFGRILGTLLAEGSNVNEEMIAKHHAVRYDGESKSSIADAHKENRQKLYQELYTAPISHHLRQHEDGYAENFLNEIVEEVKAAKND